MSLGLDENYTLIDGELKATTMSKLDFVKITSNNAS